MTSKQPLKQSISLIKKKETLSGYLQKVVVYTNAYISWSQISSSKKSGAKGVKPKVLSKDCIFTQFGVHLLVRCIISLHFSFKFLD